MVSSSDSDEQRFVPPPPAPTFEPNEEQFRDPLRYLETIRPVAELYGVVKIKPPPNWQPPFQIDVEAMKFEPRVQKLDELDGLSRCRVNFMDRLAKFWNLQGIERRVPLIDGRALDLFNLHKVVKQLGGYEQCTERRLWTTVARSLSYQAVRGSYLRNHYRTVLLPYDVYQSGKALEHVQSVSPKLDKTERPVKVRGRKTNVSLMSQLQDLKPSDNKHVQKELRHLQAYSAGKKFPGLPQSEEDDSSCSSTSQGESSENAATSAPKPACDDPMDCVVCKVCLDGGDEDRLLLCERCDGSFHTYCLLPPLKDVPDGDWLCPKCVTEEVTKPTEAYGFQQAARKYSLREFGEMADLFKRKHFKMPSHMVPLAKVESEFWRLVSGGAESVRVLYGADLLTSDVGSGFPKRGSRNMRLLPQEERYVESPWNLNNIPNLPNSALAYISTDISGMKVPWIYVGMCFSTFCWHTEDHWSYSINYLHWGEPKTWYGVSGLDADLFDEAMKSIAPDLFDRQPDLMHHLVTIINPRLLMDYGVGVYTINQCAGEFVITFPRSYHAGFNQGYNCAEAVNICPADWLAKGRMCIDHYAEVRRLCVFSHDELILQMAANAAQMDVALANAVFHDMQTMVTREQQLRNSVASLNLRQEVEEFEKLPDDDRVCQYCCTTCFLSAVRCGCSPPKQVCLKDVRHLCSKCSAKSWVMKIRYTMDELRTMLDTLKSQTSPFESWTARATEILNRKGSNRVDFKIAKALVDEAEASGFPRSTPLQQLISNVKMAEQFMEVTEQLVSEKIKNRHAMEFYHAIALARATMENDIDQFSCKLSLEEVEMFAMQLDELICRIPQQKAITDFLIQVRQFKRDFKNCEDLFRDLKQHPFQLQCEQELKIMFDRAVAFDIQLPEIARLKQMLDCITWLKVVKELLIDNRKVPKHRLDELIAKGKQLSPEPVVEDPLRRLEEIQGIFMENEQQARSILLCSKMYSAAELHSKLKSLVEVPVEEPELMQCHSLLRQLEETSSLLRHFVTYGTTVCRLEKVLKNVCPQVQLQLKLTPRFDEESVNQCRRSVAQLVELFRLPNSAYGSMYDAVAPRQVLVPAAASAIKIEDDDKAVEQKQNPDWLPLEQFESADDVKRVFAHREQAEIEMLRQHRESMRRLLPPFVCSESASKEKEKKEEAAAEEEEVIEPSTCFCRRSSRTTPTINGGLAQTGGGQLLHCWLCFNAFHVACVATLGAFPSRHLGIFVCDQCWKTKRPAMTAFTDELTVVTEMLRSCRFATKLFEVEVFRQLQRRAMTWSYDAQKFLQSDQPPTTAEYLKSLDDLFMRGLLLEVSVPELLPVLQLAVHYLPLYKGQQAAVVEVLKCSLTNGSSQSVAQSAKRSPASPSISSAPQTGEAEAKKPKPNDASVILSHGEDQQRCSAPTCKLPTGDQLTWMQCDYGCKRWFHVVCLDLPADTVNQMQLQPARFCCPSCLSGGAGCAAAPNDAQ